MNERHVFTPIIEREEDGYVALCPEFDIASQGDIVEEAWKERVSGFCILGKGNKNVKKENF